jgi:putative transposase
MTCPHCESTATTRRTSRTALGYRRFNCRSCGRRFNERTGTPFNDLHFPTDVVLLAVMWRLRYKLGFRDVAELLLQRGYEVTHETIRSWEFRFAPLLAERLRAKRRGRASVSWYLDETYVRVAGRWCYLYRAIDRDGELIDSMLSEQRDKHAARRFLRRLIDIAERRPLRVTTDRHPAYRRAIRWIIGRRATHRTTQYLNNYTEQSHRAVKQRYHPMLGFGSFEAASRFCSAFDELRQYFSVRRRGEPQVSLAERRRLFLTRWDSLIDELAAA